MIITDDLQKMTTVFATKENLRSQEDEIKKALEKFRSDILEGQDRIYKELKDFREEQSTHTLRHDDTEERLRKIESAPAIAHSIKK